MTGTMSITRKGSALSVDAVRPAARTITSAKLVSHGPACATNKPQNRLHAENLKPGTAMRTNGFGTSYQGWEAHPSVVVT